MTRTPTNRTPSTLVGTQVPNQPLTTSTPMSYAGPAGARPPKVTPRPASSGRPIDTTTDWHQVAIFGAGLAIGIAVGAGVALLTAPQDGAESRADIRRYAKR